MPRQRDEQLLKQAEGDFHAGRFARAAARAADVLSRRPKDPVAMHVLGAARLQLGRNDDAAEWLEKCVRRSPEDDVALFRLAQARSGQGRFRETVDLLDRVLKLRRGDPLALAAKAEALERLGEHDRVRDLLKPRIDAGEEHPHMALVYAKLLRRDGRHAEAIDLARRALERENAPDATRWQLWFLLGWCHEKLDDLDAAWNAFVEANRVFPATFDVEAYEREMGHLMEVFSPGMLESIEARGSSSDVPVLVVGMPRSGSTLIEQIIDAHPRAVGAGEIPALADVILSAPQVTGGEAPYPDCMRDAKPLALNKLARQYLKKLTARRKSARRVVDKLLRNFEDLGLVALLFPNARVIDSRRDPVDTCLSCFMQPLSPQEHAYAGDLAALGRIYRLYERMMRHWREALDLSMREVSYEALVSDQESVSREIIDFCGLEWDDACLRFHESGRSVGTLSYDQVRQPIYRSAVRRAEKYEKFLGPLHDALARADGDAGER